ALPSGERAEQRAGHLRHSHLLQLRHGGAPVGCFEESPEADSSVAALDDHLQRGERIDGVDARRLRHVPSAWRPSVRENAFAGKEGQQADQALEQRAFPAAVWAENSEPLAASNGKVEGRKQRLLVTNLRLLQPYLLQGSAPSDGAKGASR